MIYSCCFPLTTHQTGVLQSFSLDLPSVHGIRTELNEGIRLVKGRSIHEIPPCPKCGELHPFRHGIKVQRYIDLPVRGVKVVVDLERQ